MRVRVVEGVALWLGDLVTVGVNVPLGVVVPEAVRAWEPVPDMVGVGVRVGVCN